MSSKTKAIREQILDENLHVIFIDCMAGEVYFDLVPFNWDGQNVWDHPTFNLPNDSFIKLVWDGTLMPHRKTPDAEVDKLYAIDQLPKNRSYEKQFLDRVAFDYEEGTNYDGTRRFSSLSRAVYYDEDGNEYHTSNKPWKEPETPEPRKKARAEERKRIKAATEAKKAEEAMLERERIKNLAAKTLEIVRAG